MHSINSNVSLVSTDGGHSSSLYVRNDENHEKMKGERHKYSKINKLDSHVLSLKSFQVKILQYPSHPPTKWHLDITYGS